MHLGQLSILIQAQVVRRRRQRRQRNLRKQRKRRKRRVKRNMQVLLYRHQTHRKLLPIQKKERKKERKRETFENMMNDKQTVS
jgi:hypothetical protein